MGIDRSRVEEIQEGLREVGIDGWLLYNFRDLNPVACRLLGIGPEVHQTRRWVTLIPAEGEPRSLHHAIEPHLAGYLPGEASSYSTLQEYREQLSGMVAGLGRVAMEYSPGNSIPTVARVDAGTVELIGELGPEVVSSGELIARIESRLSPGQIEAAVAAGAACREVMRGAFRFIRESLLEGKEITEYDVVCLVERELADRELDPLHAPICAVNENSANPHYSPTESSARRIERGQVVLIDLWGRAKGREGVFGDITWTAFTGEKAPDRVQEVFGVVRDARIAALAAVVDAFGGERNDGGSPLSGADVDRAARGLIDGAGFGRYFVHRTGHSITGELHGAGTNLDASESIDDRPLLSATSFSIEPGIYLPNEFGIRSEIDVVIDATGTVIVTSEPAQSELLLLDDLDMLRSEEMD